MLQLGKRRVAKPSNPSPTTLSNTNNKTDDTNPNSKSKDGPIKVILSLFGLLVVVFIMFSVFQPKKHRPPDRPPLKVFYDKHKLRDQQNQKLRLIDDDKPNLHLDIDIDIDIDQQIDNAFNKDTIEDAGDEPNIDIDEIMEEEADPFKADPIIKDESISSENVLKPKKAGDESVDIEFIDNGNAEQVDIEEDIVNEIEDLYSKPSNPPRPPQSIHIGDVSKEKMQQFWIDGVDENDIFSSSNLPSTDSKGKIYIMNYIFLPYEQMISIFLLTSEYLDPNHGLHAWPSKKRRDSLPLLYKNIRNTIYKQYSSAPPFACIFAVNRNDNNSDLWISRVDFVPNNTTRDRYVNYGTEILRCNVPMNDINKYYDDDSSPFYDEEYKFKFLLTQKWRDLLAVTDNNNDDDDNNDMDLVHVSLSFEMGMRSGIKLYGYDDSFMFKKANQNRYLTLCIPPISEPLSFMTEHIAHYIVNIGIEHIYIGTFFKWDRINEDREKLIELIQPWYDDGLITIWPHEQPWIGFTDKAKSHWLNQCLYYVKSRDEYTLSLDADEFLILNGIDNVYRSYNTDNEDIDDSQFEERQKLMQNVLSDLLIDVINEFDSDHYCWLTFESYQMWQLLYQNEQYMIRRFIGREERAQLTWSKVIWNNKHLHFTGYHAGGSCSAQNHDWRHIIYDWREQKDGKHVYRFDSIKEGALFHYYNCRHIRIEPKDTKLRNPWSKLVNDTRMIDIYWKNIEKQLKKYKLSPTFPDPHSDVMNTKYYLTHYGKGNNMAIWHQKYHEK